MNYWEECVAVAIEEAGISATDEQLKIMTEVVEGGHDNYSMSSGHDLTTDSFESESKSELRHLKAENERIQKWKDKTEPCRNCTGTGTVGGGRFQGVASCQECNGEGRI